MKRFNAAGRLCGALLLVGLLAIVPSPSALAVGDSLAPRSTTAITYREGVKTRVDLVGTAAVPGRLGDATVKRKKGRTTVEIELAPLPHPQSLGTAYTTYVLWAVAPEGRAESLAELPFGQKVDLDVTTSLSSFGLLVAAEPHAAVRLPSPLIVAENVPTEDTRGVVTSGRLEYGGSALEAGAPVAADYGTPLPVLGARNAVRIARGSGAALHAAAELREAEERLGLLERTWPAKPKKTARYVGIANEVMRLGEKARATALERGEHARLADERRAAGDRVAAARAAEDAARLEAGRAREQAQLEANRASVEAHRASAAQVDADRARADAEKARVDAENARRDATAAQLASEESRRRLQESLSLILETRLSTRGLIVNLSDVLFDFNQATLTPGAREKLSKLAGVLIAYPGSYSLATEGHTDSVGTDAYNIDLSRRRAQSVLAFLRQAGVPAQRVTTASGFGESTPVASNDTAAGRQMNRRVEIVISDLG